MHRSCSDPLENLRGAHRFADPIEVPLDDGDELAARHLQLPCADVSSEQPMMLEVDNHRSAEAGGFQQLEALRWALKKEPIALPPPAQPQRGGAGRGGAN